MSESHCVPPVAPWRTHCGLLAELPGVLFDDAWAVTCPICRTMGRLHRLARGQASPPAPAAPTSPEPEPEGEAERT